MLAALSLGLSIADLDAITMGIVLEVIAEKYGEHEMEATQEDMDKF